MPASRIFCRRQRFACGHSQGFAANGFLGCPRCGSRSPAAPQPAGEPSRRARPRTLRPETRREPPGQHQIRFEERHLRAGGNRDRSQAHSGCCTPIVRWFPELRNDPDKRKQTITIENLLTMQSGLESTSSRNYGQWVRSRTGCATRSSARWSAIRARRWSTAPGPHTSSRRSSPRRRAGARISSRRKSSRQPLGITLARWTRDPQGIYFGGNEMLMTPRQMITFGELYLHRGRARGRHVVPAEWVDTSCVPRTRSRYDPDREYGYGWWIQDFAGHRACFAWGFGGQYSWCSAIWIS